MNKCEMINRECKPSHQCAHFLHGSVLCSSMWLLLLLLFRCFRLPSRYTKVKYIYRNIFVTTKRKCERVNKYKTMITHLYDYAYIHTV